MSKPDRELLDQINQAWDDRAVGGPTADGDMSGYDEIIDALHQADTPARTSPAFRRRLRQQLLSSDQTGNNPAGVSSESGAGKDLASPILPLANTGRGDDAFEKRRWWFSHAGELAAIILILVVAGAAVAWWQSDRNGSSQPGATGDDAQREPTALSTPVPESPGVWTGLTFQEAQIVTPFELRLPATTPEGFELETINVWDLLASNESLERSVETSPDDDARWMAAIFHYRNDNDEHIELTQQNTRITMPDLDDPVQMHSSAGESTPMGNVIRGELSVDGIDILHVVQRRGVGEEFATYTWFQDGLSMHLVTPILSERRGGEISAAPDEATMEMIEAIIRQRESDAEPAYQDGLDLPRGVEGPMAREVPPEMQPKYHRGLTFEEARELVPFDLIDPRQAHPDYDLAGVNVSVPPVGDMFHASFMMFDPVFPDRGFEISQQNAYIAAPGPELAEAVGPDGTPVESDTPDPVQEEIEIDGLPVSHTVNYNIGGDQISVYIWHQDGTGLVAHALTGINAEGDYRDNPERVVPAEDLREFVTAIIQLRESDEAPPPPEVEEAPPGMDSPADGGRHQVSLEEAEVWAPFPLLDLDVLPGELLFMAAEMALYEDGQPIESDHPDIDNPNHISLHFTSTDQDAPQIVQIVQTTDQIPNPDGEMIEVEGHPVERVSGEQGGAFETAWIWEIEGVEYGILVTTMNPDNLDSMEDYGDDLVLAESDVLEIIANTLEQ